MSVKLIGWIGGVTVLGGALALAAAALFADARQDRAENESKWKRDLETGQVIRLRTGSSATLTFETKEGPAPVVDSFAVPDRPRLNRMPEIPPPERFRTPPSDSQLMPASAIEEPVHELPAPNLPGH